MLELSQTVQTYLYANNKSQPKSFYDEMMNNKRKQEEKEAMEQQRKIELLRKKEEKEVREIVALITKQCLSKYIQSCT